MSSPRSSPSPESPISETATNARFPTSPSTGTIWAELATLTIAAFNDSLVHRLHQFILKTPYFSSQHLQMLGPIVVRHVTLQLQDIRSAKTSSPILSSKYDCRPCSVATNCKSTVCPTSLPCHCPCSRVLAKPNVDASHDDASLATYLAVHDKLEESAMPQRPRSLQFPQNHLSQAAFFRPTLPTYSSSQLQDGIPRRPSLRDVAYQAVRLRKILPSAVPSDRPCGDAFDFDNDLPSVRKLSITTPTCPHNAYKKPPHDDGAVCDPLKLSNLNSSFPSKIPKPRHRSRARRYSVRENNALLDEIADERVDAEVPASSVDDDPRKVSLEAHPITLKGNISLEPVESNILSDSRLQLKQSARLWKAQPGQPDALRLPRAGANTLLESESTRTFKYQRRTHHGCGSGPGTMSLKHSRKSHAPVPSPASNSSKLLLLRRQRERRRSSLR